MNFVHVLIWHIDTNLHLAMQVPHPFNHGGKWCRPWPCNSVAFRCRIPMHYKKYPKDFHGMFILMIYIHVLSSLSVHLSVHMCCMCINIPPWRERERERDRDSQIDG